MKQKKLRREEIKRVQALERNEELKQKYIVTGEKEYVMLRDESDKNDPGQQWWRLSSAVKEGNQKVVPEKRRRKYK